MNEISDLFVGLILLGAGGLISYSIVYKYQRDKDARETRKSVGETRERLLNIHMELSNKLVTIFERWNIWISYPIPEISMDEIQQQIAEARQMISSALFDFQISANTLIKILKVHFKISKIESELLRRVNEPTDKIATALDDFVESKLDTADLKITIDKEMQNLSKFMSSILGQILNAEPK